MDKMRVAQKRARDAAEAADEAEAPLDRLQHKHLQMEAKRAEARALANVSTSNLQRGRPRSCAPSRTV